MILFINVFLTSKRYSKLHRGLFPEVDALTVFRYMLRSLTDLKFSYIYVNAELDPDDYGITEAESLADEVSVLFRGTPVEFSARRLLSLRDWRSFLEQKLLTHNSPIFYSGNHDHIFIDRNTDILDSCLALMNQLHADHRNVSIMWSHWAEYFSYRTRLMTQGAYGFIHTSNFRDSIQVVSPELMHSWFFDESQSLSIDTPIRRTEDLGWGGPKSYLQIVPGRELLRHFDAGSHFGVRIRHVPPLRIPPGFLDNNFKIAYIAEPDHNALVQCRNEGYFCISPHFDYLACDPDGVDFKWLPEDVPQFMRRQASSFIQVGTRTEDTEKYLRDQAYADMLKDLLPLDVSALKQLAPFVITSGRGRNIPLLQKNNLAGRRSESILTLKEPTQFKAKVCIVTESTTSLSTFETQNFWRQLDSMSIQRVYVWQREREKSSWFVQASAPHLAGALYDDIDGLYCYLYDFSANQATIIRWMLKESMANTYLLLGASYGKHGDEISAWCNSVNVATNEVSPLFLGESNLKSPIAIAVSSEVLRRVYDEFGEMYFGEGMDVISGILNAINNLREKVIVKQGDALHHIDLS